MTSVLFSYRRPGGDGLRPLSGKLRFTPTRRRKEGEHIVVPKPLIVTLDADGQATINLAPTGDGWVWSVSEEVGWGGAGFYFLVPADHDQVVNFTDLEMIDPATLDPEAEPVAAWWAELGHTVTGGEVQGNDLVLEHRDGTTFNAGNVRGEQGVSVVDATQPASGELALELSDGTATTPVVLPPGPPLSVSWDGPRLTVGGEVGPDLTGPAETSPVRYDTTAGTAIYVTDGTTERLVSYDSGWRDISDRLTTGLAKSTSYGVAKIKRENGMIYLVLRLDVSGAGITSVFSGSFPTGFRPDQVLSVPGILYSATVSGKTIASDQFSWYLSQTSFIRLGAAAPNPGTLQLTASWPTDATIPGSLPGTPA